MKQTSATESAAIGSLLSGGWHHGGYKLTPEDFSDGTCRRVFTAIAAMEKRGDKVDIFTVQDALPDVDLDPWKNGGSARAISGYVELLKDNTLRRQLVMAGQQIVNGAGGGSGNELLARALGDLVALQGAGETQAHLIGDYLDEWWAELGTRAERKDWVMTGYQNVDDRLGGMRGGDLIILAGRPAMGKTALALNIAMQSRRKTLIFSLEMQAEGLLDRMAAAVAKIDLGALRRGYLNDEEWKRVTQATAKIREMPITLDDHGGRTIEDIWAQARAVRARDGLELIVIDYLQLIRGKGETYERVTNISQQAKAMAKDLNVPVLMLAQLSRKCEERGDRRPIASDLRDSGSIEQDADVIAFIYRDEVYNPTTQHEGLAELIFRKVRQGQIGTDWFTFDGDHQVFRGTDKPLMPAAPVEAGPYGVDTRKKAW